MILICAAALTAAVNAVAMTALYRVYTACKVNRGYTAIH